jgi:ankyrin repeat protein
MTTPYIPPQQTTTVGTPNAETVGIDDMYMDHQIEQVAERLENGADPNIEFASFLTEDGVLYAGLTATSAAVLADADAGGVLFTPLLLNHGGHIHQVDSRGRTLLSFAFSAPVYDYLVANGAQLPEVTDSVASGKLTDGEAANLVPHQVSCPDPVPEAEWRTLVSADMVKSLDRLGYFQTPSAAHGAATPPLIARFNPARIIDDALWEDSVERTRRLVELGGAVGPMRFTFYLRRNGADHVFEGLSAVALAALADCRNGEALREDPDDEDLFDRAGEVRLLPLFDGVVPIDGPQDTAGNTLLHLVLAPRVAEWLVRRGLSLDAVNNKGLRPFDVVPVEVRAAMEDVVIDNAVPQAQTDPSAVGGRKRL